jgi:hypothetical protein
VCIYSTLSVTYRAKKPLTIKLYDYADIGGGEGAGR